MNLAQRFYNLLSGLESGNTGPEMYVRPSGPGDYGKITHDPDYYPARGEKALWRRCAEMVTGHVEPGLDVVEFGPGDREEVEKIAPMTAMSAMPALILACFIASPRKPTSGISTRAGSATARCSMKPARRSGTWPSAKRRNGRSWPASGFGSTRARACCCKAHSSCGRMCSVTHCGARASRS
jgi:hypothetical protein